MDVYQELYKYNLSNVLMLHGLMACSIYNGRSNNIAIARALKKIRGAGWLGGDENLLLSRHLLQIAYEKRLREADDSFARIIFTAVGVYMDVDYEDDKELSVLWCSTWLEQIVVASKLSRAEVAFKMYKTITEYEDAFTSSDLLPNVTQREIIHYRE
ncbi:hypothetical protein V3W47_17490 [Deinococcus sp. YIM 134068]|uniref:hypothetical protein n=1 Tax=Deinococcus lichenicola TaxID=3118910 RepID=UPI002F959AA2